MLSAQISKTTPKLPSFVFQTECMSRSRPVSLSLSLFRCAMCMHILCVLRDTICVHRCTLYSFTAQTYTIEHTSSFKTACGYTNKIYKYIRTYEYEGLLHMVSLFVCFKRFLFNIFLIVFWVYCHVSNAQNVHKTTTVEGTPMLFMSRYLNAWFIEEF